jgi:hypothetical protein
MIASLMRLFGLATLLLAALARAQRTLPATPQPTSPAADMATGGGTTDLAGGGGGGGLFNTIKNDVLRLAGDKWVLASCTAFVTGPGCGDITIRPGDTASTLLLCQPNHAHIRCEMGSDRVTVTQCNADLGHKSHKYAVEGIAGDACTLLGRA